MKYTYSRTFSRVYNFRYLSYWFENTNMFPRKSYLQKSLNVDILLHTICFRF